MVRGANEYRDPICAWHARSLEAELPAGIWLPGYHRIDLRLPLTYHEDLVNPTAGNRISKQVPAPLLLVT